MHIHTYSHSLLSIYIHSSYVHGSKVLFLSWAGGPVAGAGSPPRGAAFLEVNSSTPVGIDSVGAQNGSPLCHLCLHGLSPCVAQSYS